MEYILLLVGFILLIKGADFFVEGSSSLAGILKVPSVIIGLTIVAMGTSNHMSKKKATQRRFCECGF